MIALTLAELAELCGGALTGGEPDTRVTGPVVSDSRQAQPGALFAALPGNHADGHEYVRSAVQAGAAAVLATRPCGVPTIVVDDVTEALARAARAVHDRLPGGTVVGVTGSSGKTSTKDLLGQLLARLGPTVAAAESYNNEIGHPLTVLRADRSTRYLVLELSARGPGHIARLTRVAPPRIGVVLNVGTAHLAEFGSEEAIARSKGELVEALPATGVAVLNVDDPRVAAMATRTRARVVRCGTSATAHVRAVRVALDHLGRPGFTLVTPEASATVRLALYGEHHVANALAVAAVARELGMTVRDTAAALTEAEPVSRWRMEVYDRADGVTVINDAYNANPESSGAALRALVALAGHRRTWAVLGVMSELGAASSVAHRDLGVLLGQLGVRRLLAVGPGTEPLVFGARREGAGDEDLAHVPDVDAAVQALQRALAPGDVVLVKGSRAAGLERVAAALAGDTSGGGGPA